MEAHGARLRSLTQDDKLVGAISSDYTRAELSPQDRAMLDYAAKLTRTPWAMTRDDLEELRRAGFRETQVVAITHIAAHFNYMNRIADALGAQRPGWKDAS